MGDLISRNKVIEVLKETGIIADDDRGHLAVQEIERMPVAYDVEKVVEEERNFLVNYGVPETAPVHRKIIDIIRGGLK